jgi:nucleotide-binding universal stress UspA family protein
MKLLLATDGSPFSEAAVREISTRPWPPGSTVTVLSVVSIPFPTDTGETFIIGEAAELASEVAGRVARQIREHAPTLGVETKTINDLPKRAIIKEAERMGADLILVGSHGHGPVQRFLLGSTSLAVALHAPCSVEIVRGQPRPDGDAPMRILLATDGSPCSEAAVREVCTRPWPPGSEIKVVTAINAFTIPDPYWTEVMVHDLVERQRTEAPALLEKTAERIRGQVGGLTVVTEVLHGSPRGVIVDEAERWGADLILVGSHGHGMVKRMLLGSVSHAVALHAPCSVEIVRSQPSPAAE